MWLPFSQWKRFQSSLMLILSCVISHVMWLSHLHRSTAKKEVSQKEIQNIQSEEKIVQWTLMLEPRIEMKKMRTLRKSLIGNGIKVEDWGKISSGYIAKLLTCIQKGLQNFLPWKATTNKCCCKCIGVVSTLSRQVNLIVLSMWYWLSSHDKRQE